MQVKSLIVLAALALSLSACTLHKITDKNELCDQAKRQEVFNNTNPSNLTSYNATDGQKAKLQSTAESCQTAS